MPPKVAKATTAKATTGTAATGTAATEIANSSTKTKLKAKAKSKSKSKTRSKPALEAPRKKQGYKPGQKYATPPPNDSLLLFYVSTYRQTNFKSAMAEKWCLEHGLFKTSKATLLDAQYKLQKLEIKK